VKKREPVRAVLSDSRDLAEYERICCEAVELGASLVACGGLAEATASQWEDPKDSYCRYFVNSPSVFKFAEAGVVRGVYPAEHVAKNMALLAAKSKILRRHGLRGIWNGLEPMWLPERFFARHPELRGPRVDHPARSLNHRFAPCIDRREILDAYAGAVRQMCEAAPALEVFEFYTNDAGAGICWCEFLYPGQNGPRGCRKIAMGQRVGNFLSAFVRGGAAAGRRVSVLMRPKHFSAAETLDYLNRLPAGSGINYRVFPTKMLTPFLLDYCLRPEWEEAMRRRKRLFFMHFPGQGAHGVRGGMPCPFLLLETLHAYAQRGVDGLTLLRPTEMHGSNRAVLRQFPSGLATEAERFRAVTKIAVREYGAALAPAVVSFWRDVDSAQRHWPLHSNDLLFQCALVERRALFEPLMERPGDVPVGPNEPWHQGQVHLGPDSKRMFLFWDNHAGAAGQTWRGLDWLEPQFFNTLGHLDRAVRELRAAAGRRGGARLEAEIDRVEIFRCLIATEAHKVQTEALWGRVAELERSTVAEAPEGAAQARRALRQVISREICNTRRLIVLLRKHPGVLEWAALEEASSSAGTGIIAKLKHKATVMKRGLSDRARAGRR
jgi:hypothetical protein